MTKDEEIVKIAYAMALGQHRYDELFVMLEKRLSETAENNEDLESYVVPAFGALESHFENALSLMQSLGRQQDTAESAIKMIDADGSPALLIQKNGRVYHANHSAQNMLGVATGEMLESQLFEYGHFQNLLSTLGKLDSFALNKTISIFGMVSPVDDTIYKVALTKVMGFDGVMMGHVSVINISWLSDVAARFEKMFKLTPVELEITHAIVTGVSLSDLAKKRKRSVGTVRLQTKKLLSKLNLRSQTELACLYSGFSKYSLSVDDKGSDEGELDKAWSRQHILMRPEGRIIDYEILGASNANPVLFLPALIGGLTINARIEQAVRENNIRLIMPWRPGMANSVFDGPADMVAFERYAKDIEALLDNLGVKTIPVIGHVSSTMWAMALSKYLPGRISKVVNVNGVVPTIKGPHLKYLDRNERLRLMTLRTAPGIGRMVFIWGLAKIDSGYDEEFVRMFVSENPCDIITTQEPAIRKGFRENFNVTTRQGYDSFIHELSIMVLDWRSFMDEASVPVKFLIGDHNVGYTEKVVSKYIEGRDGMTIELVPNTGHLLFYQRPDIVMRAVLEDEN